MKIGIYLRDCTKSPCRMIVEVERETDSELSDQIEVQVEEDADQKIFTDFVLQVRTAMPIRQKNVDVYIACWGQQSAIIPQEFFELITETHWPVRFDIND